MKLIRLRRPSGPDQVHADGVAGLTVAAYAIPQVMAYAGVAGLGPIAGLWSMLPALAIYALIGSSRHLSVGPESTTALMTAVIIAPMVVGDPSRYALLVAVLALLVGLICLGAWALRLGFIADLLSRPVLIGYMAGIAVVMVVSQLHTLTGARITGRSFISETASFFSHLSTIHWPTVALAVSVLVILVVTERVWPRLPGPLMTVAAATFVVWGFDLAHHGLEVVGSVPSGLPIPHWPTLRADDIQSLLLPAVGVAVVGFTDNVLTARAFASRSGDEIDANRELLALAGANMGAAMFRGFPVSSSGSRTALSLAAGGRSQWASLVALATIMLTLVAGGRLLAYFPKAALGGLIVYAAAKLVDVPEIRRIARFRRSELILLAATTISVLALEISYGVMVAVTLSLADVFRRIARPHDAILGYAPGVAGMHDIDDYPGARTIDGLLVYRYDASLFFANAEDFRRRALAAADSVPNLRWSVLNVEANMPVDITGLDAMEDVRASLASRGVVMALARVKHDLMPDLVSSGLADRIGTERLFPTLPTAVAAYEASVPSDGERRD
jgi:high affinity sulfate transporter 1